VQQTRSFKPLGPALMTTARTPLAHAVWGIKNFRDHGVHALWISTCHRCTSNPVVVVVVAAALVVVDVVTSKLQLRG
jgi:hypothetical protein